MQKPKDSVLITIRITHPKNRMHIIRRAANRGGKWVDKISAFYLRRQTELTLFNIGFTNKHRVVDVILNGRHVILRSVGTDGIARFEARP
jgi:hypothetical protein